MVLFLLSVLSLILAPATANENLENCVTPNQKPGKCVLISHCPHLFSAITNQTTTIPKYHVQNSHCGFESIWFPKVCCPNEAMTLYPKVHRSKHASKCGLHVPGGDDDPWLALLEYENFVANDSRAFFCGGVLIHKKFVLTTAHCIRERSKLYGVYFGGKNPTQSVPVDGIVIHEDYNPDNRSNDIALIRLKKKVSFKNGAVRPICLSQNSGDRVGSLLALAGWQKTPNDTTTFLKRAELGTVRENSECGDLRDSQICVSLKDKNHIDFGGILMEVSSDTSYSLVGLMSKACCGNDGPMVYVKVSSYVNWIISNLDM